MMIDSIGRVCLRKDTCKLLHQGSGHRGVYIYKNSQLCTKRSEYFTIRKLYINQNNITNKRHNTL